MAEDCFFLVPSIIEGKKYFDVSRDEIVRQLVDTGVFDREDEHTFSDEYGNDCTVVLRLNISARGVLPECWTSALKLGRQRIDGVDHERQYDGPDGKKITGWHRHVWDAKKQSAESNKQPLDDFRNVTSRDQFLVRVMDLMNVTLNRIDHGTDELPFPEIGDR